MAFLVAGGLTIPCYADSWRETTEYVGNIDSMSVGGATLAIEGTRRRKWTFRTTPLAASDALFFQKWLEGRGQSWRFADQFSATGIGPSVAGTLTYSAAGRVSTRVTVGSASKYGVKLLNKLWKRAGWAPTDGYSFGFWSYRTIASDGVAADGWYFFVVVGAVSFTQGTANPGSVTQYKNGVAGAWSLGNICQVNSSTPYVAIYGYRLGGAALDKDYSDMFAYPFQLTAAQVLAIYTEQNTGSGREVDRLPRITIHGDCVEDTTPVEVRMRVKDVEYMGHHPASGGGFSAAGRILHVEVTEW